MFSVQKSGSGSWGNGKEGLTLTKGDRIKTDSGGKAVITFFDGSIIELNGGTEISLDELIAKSASSFKTIKIGQKNRRNHQHHCEAGRSGVQNTK